MLDAFVRKYTGLDYRYTATVRHQGKVIAFALAVKAGTQPAASRPVVVYSVLDLEPGGDVAPAGGSPKSPFDVDAWSATLQELGFPSEIAEAGYGVADQTALPAHKKDKPEPEAPGTPVPADERDAFLSSTARLTALAPFQALSDGKHVYLFRQAVAADDPHAVFKRDRAGDAVLDRKGRPVPLVDATLLVDRFVLVGDKLLSKREVRYQRSRSKSRPQSRKDSLGDKDLDGKPFVEPSLELSFVGGLSSGRFTVLLLPTLVVGIQRWQIFAYNGASGRIDGYNVERAQDGLFNLKGTQFYSSPDPRYQKDVFEPRPGTDPFTGEALVPFVSSEGHAEAALEFDGDDDRVELGQGVVLGASYTQEAWILPTRPSGTEPQPLLTSQPEAAACRAEPLAAPSLWIERQTRLRIGFGDGSAWHEFTTKSILAPQAWNHVAVSFDGEAIRVWVNGRLRDKAEALAVYQQGRLRTSSTGEPSLEALAGITPAASGITRIGASSNSSSGCIDEIRLWSRARGGAELRADMSQRLTGGELGLAAYWRFDEGRGASVYDQTDRHQDGTVDGATWVTSDAPLGQGKGLLRNSFRIATRDAAGALEVRSVETGLSALLYDAA